MGDVPIAMSSGARFGGGRRRQESGEVLMRNQVNAASIEQEMRAMKDAVQRLQVIAQRIRAPALVHAARAL
jgi:hypothetical protein